MAVRTKAQLEAAFAAIYADGQADDAITPARIRAFWVDFAESLLDNPAILQGTLDANVVTSMLRNSAVESGKIGDDAVVEAKIADGAITGPKIAATAAAQIRSILQGLAAGQRLGFAYLDGRISAAQAPADTVFSAALAPYRTEAQINALVAAALTAAVTGNTETGITVTYAGGKLNFVVSGSSTTPTQPATFYYGLSTDNAFTAGEYTAVPSQTNPAEGFVVPAPAANSFIAFAVPDTHSDLAYISRNHATGDNQLSTFDRIAGTITLGGVAHKAWRSDTIGFPAAVGGTWYVN